jgi:hypothetical protein
VPELCGIPIPSEGGIEHQAGPSSIKCDDISHRPVQHNHQTPITTSDMLFKPGIFPPSIAFLNPKCALWDCPRPAQGGNEGLVYCSSFHEELALSEGAPGMCPVLRPGGIDLKDGPLFAALTARVNGRAVGIPELHGAATSKTPWNATGKPYSFSKFCAGGCSICSELCHFSLYFRVLSITLNPLCQDKAICDFWSNRLGSFCLCSSATVIENNSVHNAQ